MGGGGRWGAEGRNEPSQGSRVDRPAHEVVRRKPQHHGHAEKKRQGGHNHCKGHPGWPAQPDIGAHQPMVELEHRRILTHDRSRSTGKIRIARPRTDSQGSGPGPDPARRSGCVHGTDWPSDPVPATGSGHPRDPRSAGRPLGRPGVLRQALATCLSWPAHRP